MADQSNWSMTLKKTKNFRCANSTATGQMSLFCAPLQVSEKQHWKDLISLKAYDLDGLAIMEPDFS